MSNSIAEVFVGRPPLFLHTKQTQAAAKCRVETTPVRRDAYSTLRYHESKFTTKVNTLGLYQHWRLWLRKRSACRCGPEKISVRSRRGCDTYFGCPAACSWGGHSIDGNIASFFHGAPMFFGCAGKCFFSLLVVVRFYWPSSCAQRHLKRRFLLSPSSCRQQSPRRGQGPRPPRRNIKGLRNIGVPATWCFFRKSSLRPMFMGAES